MFRKLRRRGDCSRGSLYHGHMRPVYIHTHERVCIYLYIYIYRDREGEICLWRVVCIYIDTYIYIYGGCPIFLYLKTTLSPCLSRTFRGLPRPKENPQKLHLTTITKAYMLTHIILPFRRPFRRAFADLSRPQKSTHFASHMFRLYIKCKQGF